MLREIIGHFDVELVEEASEAKVPVNSRNRRGPLGIDRLQLETGFEPQVPIREGLRAYVDWIKTAREKDLF
jgi:nucleoside-diphosphate-sugar epimerase